MRGSERAVLPAKGYCSTHKANFCGGTDASEVVDTYIVECGNVGRGVAGEQVCPDY